MILDFRAVAVSKTTDLQSGELTNILEEPSTASYWRTRSQIGAHAHLRNDGQCHISEGIALIKSDAPCIVNSTSVSTHFGAIISSSVRPTEKMY